VPWGFFPHGQAVLGRISDDRGSATARTEAGGSGAQLGSKRSGPGAAAWGWSRRLAAGAERAERGVLRRRQALAAGTGAELAGARAERAVGAQAQMQAAAGVERGCSLAARMDSAAQARASESWSAGTGTVGGVGLRRSGRPRRAQAREQRRLG
jgi:hypothetical protein